MLVIGLTGGIGSGKSEVSRRFSDLGVPIVDTDLISRELVAPGKPALEEIRETLGAEFVTDTGNLDRKRLRDAIFQNPSIKTKLEDILHPRIRERVGEALGLLDSAYAIVVVPLLLETRYPIPVDRVLVVDVPEALQISRVAERDGIPESAAQQILDRQASRNDRLQAADDVIANDGDLSILDAQVEMLHGKYLSLSAAAD